MLQSISPVEERFFPLFFLSFFSCTVSCLFYQLFCAHECVEVRQRERERVSAESSVTSWPLHVKQYVVRCQWLKQRYARLHVCTVPTNSLKRLVCFIFASIVLHKEAVGHWKKACIVKNIVVYLTKQPSLQNEMVGDALKKTAKFKRPNAVQMQKKKKKIPRKKKIIVIRIKKKKFWWCEATVDRITWKGPPPSAPEWSNRRVMENHVHPRCQAEVWTALSVESRVSSCLKTHILGWYWIYSPKIFKVWHSGRLETTGFVWLAQLWVKQHPDNLSLISIWFLSLSLFLFQLQKLGKLSTDNTKSTWGQIRREAKLT